MCIRWARSITIVASVLAALVVPGSPVLTDACASISLDAMLGTSNIGVYWNGENCVRGREPAPRARYGHSMVTIGNGAVIMFGGKTPALGAQRNVKSSDAKDTYRNDVDLLDVKRSVWIRLVALGTLPHARAAHTAVSWRGASGTWKMTIFSGAGAKFVADAHTFDVATNTWSELIATPPPPPGETPKKRSYGTAVSWVDELSGAWQMTLFAGGSQGAKGDLDDVHTLNLATGAWSGTVTTTGIAPEPRFHHSAVSWRSTSGEWKMTIFGGIGLNAMLADVNTLTLASSVWSGTISTTGTAPSPRLTHTAVGWTTASGARQMTIYGGYDYFTAETFAAVFTLDLGADVWSFMGEAPNPSLSGRRGFHAAASVHDEASGEWKMVSFGGQSSVGYLAELSTLALDTNVWSTGSIIANATAGPSARVYHTAVSWRDAASDEPQMTIYAGYDNVQTAYGDVHVLNLANGVWSGAISTAGTAPHPRFGHTAVSWRDDTIGEWLMTIFAGKVADYDVGAVVMGNDVHTLNLATNEWSGTVTTTGTVPSSRYHHTAVTWRDTASAWKMTVFAGDDGFGVSKSDVHTLDLVTSAWSGLISTTGQAPAPRYLHTAVSWLDTASDGWQMTISGGQNGDGVHTSGVETLDLSTGAWSGVVRTTGAEPSLRFGASAVSWSDPSSSAWKMAIFGGAFSGTAPTDVSILDLATNEWHSPSAIFQVGDLGRVFHSAIQWRHDASNTIQMSVWSGRTDSSGLVRGEVENADVGRGSA